MTLPRPHPLDSAEAHELYRIAEEMLVVLRTALEHVDELEEAWRRGLIQEGDIRRMAGTRSNRNVDARVALNAAIQAAGRVT